MASASNTVDDAEAEAPPRPNLVLRLKRLLVAPLLLLRRLRKPGTEEEGAEPEAGTAPAAPSLWRHALPYVLALLAGTAAGGGAIYWLSGRIIARQAASLAAQEDEVARLKGVLAGYDRMMLQNRKKLEEEQGRRAEAENRLGMAQTDLARRQQAQPPSPGAGHAAGGAQGRAVDCTLRPGSIGSTLKGCIEEFNR